MAQNMYAESLRAFLKPVIKYLDDEAVSEIMINGPTDIWIEKKGKLIKTDAVFTEELLLGCARNIAQFVGRRLNEEVPRLDARLPDGSRVHAVIPPIARKGTTISIRKFFKDKLTIDKLVEFGSMTAAMARFIEGCVRIKENIIVAGGTGSGKTTLLNIVSSLIPNDERILTIEDSAELQLNQEHIVPFESRPPDKFGKGEVNMGHLLHSALRLRPDRIVVGEVRGGEAFDLMQAMNTGHGGSLATTHANTPVDTLRRIESLCLQSGIELPMVAVRAQVASAINMVITCERLQDGSRKTTNIAEVLPLNEKGDYRAQDIFVFTPTHKDEDGKIHGYHAPTGVLPHFMSRLHAYGFTDMTEEFFDPETYGVPPPPIFTSDGVKTHWVKRFKNREDGQADDEAQQKKWAEERLKKGKEVEAAARAKEAAAAAAKKAAEANKPPEPKPEPAPQPRAEARPAEPQRAPQPGPSSRPPQPSQSRPAQPAMQRPSSANTAAPKTGNSIQVASDLLEEGEVTHEPPQRQQARPQPRQQEPDEPAEDESYEEPVEEEERPAPQMRRPGPSRPAPTSGYRPGPSRPAPTSGYRRVDDEPEEEAVDPSLSDSTVIRPPRR